jgi:hypothetical protein
MNCSATSLVAVWQNVHAYMITYACTHTVDMLQTSIGPASAAARAMSVNKRKLAHADALEAVVKWWQKAGMSRTTSSSLACEEYRIYVEEQRIIAVHA